VNAAAVELPAKIHRGIPLSQATGCRITHVTARQIAVDAPLGPNINVHGCGSAGGLNAVGILTARGLGTHIIVGAGLDAELVVAEARVR
jgi:thioesterase domain-containing protein